MSVYDKELIIDGKAVRSPEQQVYKNMKDIQALQEIVKKMYKTSEVLTDASVSVAIADTNAPEGTTEGWLITEDGLLFSITGGDETNLLLAYYSDLKGPQGIPGSDLYIDDSTTADDKTWSSNKISSGVDKGSYITKTAPTLVTGTMYTLNVSNIFNKNDNVDIKKNDLIIYLNDGVADSIYVVFDIAGSIITLIKDGEFSQGTQLYQHNVKVTKTGTINFYGILLIVNDSPTEFNLTSLKQYLTSKGYDDNNHRPCNGGFATSSSKLYAAESICIYDYYGDMVVRYYYANDSGTVQGGNDVDNSMVVKDNVETL